MFWHEVAEFGGIHHFHYSIILGQCSISGSNSAQNHDGATTVLVHCSRALKPHLDSSKHCHFGHKNEYFSTLNMNVFPHWAFGMCLRGSCKFQSSLTVLILERVKFASLWPQVFQQFPVHGRHEPQQTLIMLTNFLSSEEDGLHQMVYTWLFWKQKNFWMDGLHFIEDYLKAGLVSIII